VKLRHAAAFALFGWYLMVPPTKEAVDSDCGRGDIWIAFRVYKDILSFVAPAAADRVDEAKVKQCDREGIVIAADAPLGAWNQAGEFETLAACEAEQRKPFLALSKCIASDDPRLAK